MAPKPRGRRQREALDRVLRGGPVAGVHDAVHRQPPPQREHGHERAQAGQRRGERQQRRVHRLGARLLQHAQREQQVQEAQSLDAAGGAGSRQPAAEPSGAAGRPAHRGRQEHRRVDARRCSFTCPSCSSSTTCQAHQALQPCQVITIAFSPIDAETAQDEAERAAHEPLGSSTRPESPGEMAVRAGSDVQHVLEVFLVDAAPARAVGVLEAAVQVVAE
ncbi:hypothetical protein ON010_g19051 [Phytophthora cinnamomi]|nr:hypothetical protein ON010_g19051 [Phytophthora cinnamomi]